MSAPARVGPGRLITFEGGEGAGKSTQIRLLAERLARAGVETVSTREPGGTPKAERLRELLLSGRFAARGPLFEAMLFAAARIDHVDGVIAPALKRGAFVLCDRFVDSTRAYQGAMGKVDPDMIRLLETVALAGATPDATFMLDLPPAEGLARAARRRGAGARPDRFEREASAFHEGLRQAFLRIAAQEKERCVVIDAAPPPEEVAKTIWRKMTRRFPLSEETPA